MKNIKIYLYNKLQSYILSIFFNALQTSYSLRHKREDLVVPIPVAPSISGTAVTVTRTQFTEGN